MFRLDESFLEGIGVKDMPEAEMQAFLEHLQEELEVRVGERMSEGLSEAQIEEFEKIIDGDEGVINTVLAAAGDYRNDERYKKLVEVSGLAEGSAEVAGEYASVLWLQKNRPDYQDIVKRVSEELKAEVAAGKDKIAGEGAAASDADASPVAAEA